MCILCLQLSVELTLICWRAVPKVNDRHTYISWSRTQLDPNIVRLQVAVAPPFCMEALHCLYRSPISVQIYTSLP